MSRARVPFGSAPAGLIYLQAFRRNGPMGLTGFLHHQSGLFLQHLEGPAANLARMRTTILKDGRHGEAVTLRDGPIRDRLFAGWAMAFAGPGARLAERDLPMIGGGIPPPEVAERLLAFMLRVVRPGRGIDAPSTTTWRGGTVGAGRGRQVASASGIGFQSKAARTIPWSDAPATLAPSSPTWSFQIRISRKDHSRARAWS